MVFHYNYSYSLVENPEALAVAVGVILFVLVFYGFNKISRNRGVSIVIAFVLSLIASWHL